MGTQAPATPTPGQTPQDLAKAAADARRTAILTAYEVLRPASEVDARAQRVLVSSLVLIAFSVMPKKPGALNFGGLSFAFSHWLTLGIPLALVVLYLTGELALAWRIHWKRVNLILGGATVTLRDLAHDDLVPIVARDGTFRGEAETIQAKRKEIWAWYERRSEEVRAQNRALEEQERFPGDSYAEQARNSNAVEEEFAKRNEYEGITEFDKGVDEVLHTGLDRDRRVIEQNQKAIGEMEQFLALKKVRLRIGLILPLTLSAFSLLTFVWAVCTIMVHRGR